MTDSEDDEGEEQVKVQTSDVFEDAQFELRWLQINWYIQTD